MVRLINKTKVLYSEYLNRIVANIDQKKLVDKKEYAEREIVLKNNRKAAKSPIRGLLSSIGQYSYLQIKILLKS